MALIGLDPTSGPIGGGHTKRLAPRPPDRPPPSPRDPCARAHSGLNPISSGRCVSAGFSTQAPTMAGAVGCAIGAA